MSKWIINGPWIIGVDFYAILYHHDRQRKTGVDLAAESESSNCSLIA